MNRALMKELEKLAPEERVRLAYDLLKSAASEAASAPISEAQRDLVRRRLADYRANPDEPVATLSDIKRDLGLS